MSCTGFYTVCRKNLEYAGKMLLPALESVPVSASIVTNQQLLSTIKRSSSVQNFIQIDESLGKKQVNLLVR
jgi:hypothetical protein